MFDHDYPYTNLSEINLDYVLKQLKIFRSELDNLSGQIYEQVMNMVQPQIDTIVQDFNTLAGSFEDFKSEIRGSQTNFEEYVNNEIADLERDFNNTKDQLDAMVKQAKLYSDIQNDNLYNKIVEDIAVAL